MFPGSSFPLDVKVLACVSPANLPHNSYDTSFITISECRILYLISVCNMYESCYDVWVIGWCCAQKNLNEKVLPQLEKIVMSKLEVTMTKQLKFQFQTSGKQSLQVRCCVLSNTILSMSWRLFDIRTTQQSKNQQRHNQSNSNKDQKLEVLSQE